MTRVTWRTVEEWLVRDFSPDVYYLALALYQYKHRKGLTIEKAYAALLRLDLATWAKKEARK